MNISEMLAKNAQIYPVDIALIELRPSKSFRKEITWRQFDERVNKIANSLIDKGIRKGDRVIHWMMNSINWLEVYFGIVRTGAWVVPLNFRFSSADLKYCADVAQAKTMILGEEFTERLEAVRSELPTIKDYICVGQNVPKDAEAFEDMIDKSSPKPVEIELRDEDGCSLYFTSGTTGAPKPILLSHKNMECAAITENLHHYKQHKDNMVIMAPLYHTGSKMYWLGNLMVGARGTILTEVNPQYIFEAFDRTRGTVGFLAVPWIQDILGALDRGELKQENYDLSCWRLVYLGAQPVPPSLIKHWKEYFPSMGYDNVYGLTESSGPNCIHLGVENEYKIPAIGKAGLNWEARIVDDNGKDVILGEIGELVVRGNGVMKEYYKNPEKTAETIKGGWLYTGDMARMDSERFIYLVDRKKDVVISGGENIYPVEIEEVLQGHPKIYDVAVVGIPDERLGEKAVAVIDPKLGESLSKEEVEKFYQLHLPKYKWPRRIIFDKVPRNPTGKIEKPKLREKYVGN